MSESNSQQQPEPADVSARSPSTVTDADQQQVSPASDAKLESRVKIVFISGQQGSGKSAFAEALFSCVNGREQRSRVVLFDGDVWALGYDPTIGPNPPPESKVTDDTPFRERMTAISAFLATFRGKAKEEEATDDADDQAFRDDEKQASAWQPFYAAMCESALRTGAKKLQQLNDDDCVNCVVLITHAVYRRSMRLFVKSQLGDHLARWIFVDPSPQLAIQRAAERCAKQYAAMGKSAEDWAMLLEPNSAGFQRPSNAEVDALGGIDTGKVVVLENNSQDVDNLTVLAENMLADGTLF